MYSVLPELYYEAAARLTDAIGGQNYYSGSLVFPFGDIECRFTASIIIYREKLSMPEGDFAPISDLVPVWWEFHTTAADGEVLNDFDFSELKLCI